MEMPEIPQQPDLGPVADSGQECVHQHDAIDVLRVLRSVGVSHHQPDVVADDRYAAEAEYLREGMDVLRHGLLVVTGLRFG